ncbi:hypothetical protein CC2G_010552 [Coprinopsis cinerea AmutBmut pab1-1]|nr:hypothetical protein CC2G_010552 [Coprinopsis cinerea AmutBmut pab1-1]
MILLASLGLYALVLFSTLRLVHGLPALNSFFGRGLSGQIVVGVTPIEAIATVNRESHYAPAQTRHLTREPGTIGNLTILPNDRMPVLYYLTKETLWQYVNETTILPVNVHNVTESALKYRHPPFQLVIGRKIEGIRGSWRFAGSMLYYEFPGKEETQGLFFKCEPSSGFSGVFMFYQQREEPIGCEPFTLHSFIPDDRR